MKKIIFIIASIFFVFKLEAQQVKEKFAVEIEYLTYKPKTYDDSEKKWPLVIFLHGAGERGTDIEKIKVHGPPMQVEKGTEFPFILISPQAKRGWDPELLFQMIANFIENNKVDTDKVYLTGLSMGGYGTWRLAMKHPEIFAAIAPICGGGDPSETWKLRNMPVWCFHGAKDQVVPLSASESMINALKQYNSNVKFTVYPEVYHDSWKNAYDDPEFYKWLLAQKKHKFKPIALSQKKLSSFSGKYNYKMMGQEGTFNMTIEDGKLVMDLRSRKTVLTPCAENKFFIQENNPVEVQFFKDDKGKVNRAVLYANESFAFNKIE